MTDHTTDPAARWCTCPASPDGVKPSTLSGSSRCASCFRERQTWTTTTEVHADGSFTAVAERQPAPPAVDGAPVTHTAPVPVEAMARAKQHAMDAAASGAVTAAYSGVLTAVQLALDALGKAGLPPEAGLQAVHAAVCAVEMGLCGLAADHFSAERSDLDDARRGWRVYGTTVYQQRWRPTLSAQTGAIRLLPPTSGLIDPATGRPLRSS